MEPDPTTSEEEPTPAPLLELRDGLPPVVADDAGLGEVADALASGTGPIAVDAERASGYRYSARAYLLQLRREGAGSFLVDPVDIEDFAPLARVLGEDEWILHAATQDLPCLTELGLHPAALFDTELAGRLLGYPRVGLATLVETVLGFRMRKEHSAVDWSTRPLPSPWLEYAALDVEVLPELRDALAEELVAAGKQDWAAQEFAALLDHRPAVRRDPWRRTSGMHKARGRRALAAVRALWTVRDEIAADRDVTPGRILPDSAIVAAANALPRDRRALLTTPGFKGRGAERYSTRWLEALAEARSLPDADLPPVAARFDGPPPPRAWADRDPLAAARLQQARADLLALAEERSLPVENLLTPDSVRRLLWQPPAVTDDVWEPAVAERLGDLGARQWQIDLTTPVLARALREARPTEATPESESVETGS